MRFIKLMADYNCYPLWEDALGEVGNIDPASLPISKDLVEKLFHWANAYDKTLNEDDPLESGFSSHQEEVSFKALGKQLGERLRDELGADFELKMEI